MGAEIRYILKICCKKLLLGFESVMKSRNARLQSSVKSSSVVGCKLHPCHASMLSINRSKLANTKVSISTYVLESTIF